VKGTLQQVLLGRGISRLCDGLRGMFAIIHAVRDGCQNFKASVWSLLNVGQLFFDPPVLFVNALGSQFFRFTKR
jgi:hypothetical protein